VVDGKIATRTKFPEGTKLVLQVEEPAPVVELDAKDERATDRALASVREGRGISLDKFHALLERLCHRSVVTDACTVVIAPEAVIEASEIAAWWNENRLAAPRLCSTAPSCAWRSALACAC
jgi:hypothetical protein